MIEGRDLPDIGAADKGAPPGAGEDREPQFGVGGDLGHLRDDLLHQRPVEAVELGRVVDRQPRDAAALGLLFVFDQKTVRGHAQRAGRFAGRFDCPRSSPAQASCRHLCMTVPARYAVIPALSCGGLSVLTSNATKSRLASPSRDREPLLGGKPAPTRRAHARRHRGVEHVHIEAKIDRTPGEPPGDVRHDRRYARDCRARHRGSARSPNCACIRTSPGIATAPRAPRWIEFLGSTTPSSAARVKVVALVNLLSPSSG